MYINYERARIVNLLRCVSNQKWSPVQSNESMTSCSSQPVNSHTPPKSKTWCGTHGGNKNTQQCRPATCFNNSRKHFSELITCTQRSLSSITRSVPGRMQIRLYSTSNKPDDPISSSGNVSMWYNHSIFLIVLYFLTRKILASDIKV